MAVIDGTTDWKRLKHYCISIFFLANFLDLVVQTRHNLFERFPSEWPSLDK